ncbi:hypothetical protein E3U55_14660 [Filobacillus milosensis]|uniref:Uncharacterized protein n=1 Tax=Filobacillus milosensis TaxID=94137 RepID=A0A4Y8IGJ5_9BACI|nr:hypothetical protein [Filobacillus milosensis]TFB14151.1 hypothetical protein E3U55_14660 [Filobacillus milosensis]
MNINKRRSSFFIWLSLTIIFSPLLIYLFIPKFLGDEQQYFTFEDIEVAEQKIGDIKTPVMPERYEIKKITYDHDGFTYPVTKIFYEKGNHKITFMIASSWFNNLIFHLKNLKTIQYLKCSGFQKIRSTS